MKPSYPKTLIALVLIGIIAPLKFSILGVPFIMQSLVIFTSAAVFGIVPGMAASLIYLLLGAAGVPIFPGFQSGLEKLTGPTAGFLWSLPLIAAYIGWQVRSGEQSYFHYMIYFFRAHILWLIPGFVVLHLNYEGLDLMSTAIRLMPDVLAKSLVGALLGYWGIQKIPPD